MVAVVAGNGLGLVNSSLGQLGQAWGQAGIGQAGLGQYVNVANGNLVLRDPGQALVFDGSAFEMLATYNSQGQMQGGHGWLFGFDRSVGGLTGDLGTAGSTLTRTAEDGSTTTYTYDAASGDYLSEGAAGAQDRLHWDATSATWAWTDGASHVIETYDASGRLMGLRNPETGASFTLAWLDGHVATVTAGDGDELRFGYDTAGHLTSLSISEVPPGGSAAVLRQAVAYTYDAQGRLTQVTTTLGSDTYSGTGTYTTSFTYDGSSDRIASMTQGDGTTVAYAYTQGSDGVWRVTGILAGTGDDAQQVTLSYASDETTVTDALGNAWTYGYDADGRLTSVGAPEVGGQPSTTHYAYDANGNITATTDANGGVTRYTYDTAGNLLSATDATGVTVAYAYDDSHHMLSRTVYRVAAQGVDGEPGYVPASGAETTHYVYDGQGHLAYTIDAAGAVTRQDWTTLADGTTVLSSTYAWRGATFDAGAGEPALADLTSWEAAHASAASQGQRSDYTYDARGQVATRTDYATLDANGQGILDAAASVTRTTYDAFGRLLQTGTVRGADRDVVESSSFAYDGMGRLVATTDALGHKTTYVYLDNHNTVEIIEANGLLTVQVRNSAGLLISSTQSAGTPALAGQTFFNAQGKPVASVDAQGGVTYSFYDSAGRIAATVDAQGHLVAHTYDAAGHEVATVAYAQALDTEGWLGEDGPSSSMPTTPPLPARSSGDVVTLAVYDANGNQVASVSPTGVVVVTTRDTAGHAVSIVTYDATLSASQVSALGLTPTLADVQGAVFANAYYDKVTTVIYDDQGRETATIDPSGIVTLMDYDGQGRLIHRLTYDWALDAPDRQSLGATPTRAQVVALMHFTKLKDKQAFWFYGADGNVAATVAEDGSTEYMTYSGGKLVASEIPGTALSAAAIDSLASNPSLSALDTLYGHTPGAIVGDLTLYDDAGHVAAVVSEGGSVQRFVYGVDGKLIATRSGNLSLASLNQLAAAPSASLLDQLLNTSGGDGSQHLIYGANGLLAATLDPVGSSSYTVTRYYYDDAGRVVAKILMAQTLTASAVASMGNAPTLAQLDALTQGFSGNATELHYYDADGREVATAVQGKVTTRSYDAAGHMTAQIVWDYGTRAQGTLENGQLDIPSLADFTGGLSESIADDRTFNYYDDQGRIVAQLVSRSSYDWWNGYTNVPDVTYYYYSDDGRTTTSYAHYGVTDTYGFYYFSQDPSYANVQSYAPSTWGYLTTITVTDDAGRVMAVMDPQTGRHRYTYDAAGDVTEDFWGWNVDLDDSGEATQAQDLLDQIDAQRDQGGFTLYVRQADATGTTTYAVGDDSTVVVTRTNAQGQLLAQAEYDDVSPDIFTATQASMDPALVRAALATAGAPASLHVTDALGNDVLSIDDDGVLTYTQRDATGAALGEVVYNALPASTLLLAAAVSGDADAFAAAAGVTADDLYTTSYTDGQGRLLATVGLYGEVTTYRYDALGQLLFEDHYANRLTTEGREALGTHPTLADIERAVGTSDADYSLITLYDASGKLVASTTSGSQLLLYTYDSQGRLIESTGSPITQHQIRELGDNPTLDALRIDLAINRGDKVAQSIYDASGNLVASIDDAGHVEVRTYDANGNLTQVRDYEEVLSYGFGYVPTLAALLGEIHTSPSDQVTRYIYDGSNRLAATIAADGKLTIRSWQADGTAKEIVYATPLTPAQIGSLGDKPSLAGVIQLVSGQISSQYFDAAGRLVASIDAQDRATWYFYDAQGRLASEVDAAGGLTTYTYDDAGQVVRTTRFATPIDVSAWRDPATGRPTEPSELAMPAASPADRTTILVRDSAGRVVASVDGAGAVTTFAYDGEGRIIRETVRAAVLDTAARAALPPAPSLGDIDAAAPAGSADRATRSIYDASGRLAAQIDAAGFVTRYTYDAAGNITGTRVGGTAVGDAALVALDAAPSLATLDSVWATSTQDLVTRTFRDGQGRVVATIDAAGYLTTYAYDEASHTTTSTRHALALPPATVAGLADDADAATLAGLLANDDGAQATQDQYDANGELVKHVDAFGATTIYGYDAVGDQTSWSTTDAFGTYSGQASYDAFGNLVTRTSGTGEVSTQVWNARGQLQLSSDAAGFTTYYYYDAAGRLAATLETGHYDLTTFVDRGAVTTYSYNAFGEVDTTTRYGNLLTLGAGALDPLFASSDSLLAALAQTGPGANAVSHATYDGDGRVASTVDGAGFATTFAYDAFGEIIATTREVAKPADGLPAVLDSTTYAYDARGERIAVVQAAGTAIARELDTTYDAFGRVASTTDGMGHVTTYTYDRLGRQIAIADSVDGKLRQSGSSYDAFGRVVTQVDALGNTTTFAYDAATDAVTVTTPGGVQMTTVRDALGDVVRVIDGAGNTTTYTYDAAGRLVSVTDPLGHVDTTEYPSATTVQTHGDHGDTLTLYDRDGRVLMVTDNGATTRYVYDGAGRLLTVTEPAGGVVTYTYDDAGNLVTRVQDPTGANVRTTYTYDGEGRQVSMTVGRDGDAVTTSYTYDALGRLITSTVDPAGQALATQYSYDKDDRLVCSTDPLGLSTWWVRDEAGQPLYTFTPAGGTGSGLALVTQTLYDLEGHVTASTTFSHAVSTAGLDALVDGDTAGNLATAAALAAQASGSVDRATATIRDVDGRLRFSMDADGLVTEWRYDALGRVTATLAYLVPVDVAGTFGAALAAGTVDEAAMSAALASAGDSDASSHATYSAYDANGNVIATIAAVEAAGQRGYIVTTMTYTAGDKVASATVYTTPLTQAQLDGVNAGDDLASLLVATQPAGSALTTRYVYDDHQRQAAVIAADGTTTFTVYNDDGTVAETVDPDGVPTQYLYDNLGRVTSVSTLATRIDTTQWLDGDAIGPAFGEFPWSLTTRTTETTYDSAGRISAVFAYDSDDGNWQPGGEATIYHYDRAGMLSATDDVGFYQNNPQSFATSMASATSPIDDKGYSVEETRTTHYYHDADGRLTGQLDPTGALTTFTLDAAGRAISSTTYATLVTTPTDALATTTPAAASADRTTQWFRDDRGNVLGEIDAAGYLTTFAYDPAGRQVGSVRYGMAVPAGARGDLASAQAAVVAAPVQATAATYDAEGRITSNTNTEGTVTTWTYDLAGHVLSQTTAAGTAEARSMTSAYNALGQLVSSTDVAGATTQYAYDAVGRLTTVTDTLGNTTWHVYDASGNELFTVRGMAGDDGSLNGHADIVARTFDAFGDVTELTRYASVADLDGTYDGGIDATQALIDALPGTENADEVIDYTYDTRGHVTSVYGSDVQTTSSYNRFGELFDLRDQSNYDHTLNTYYTYDADGRVISKQQFEMASSMRGSGGFGAPIEAVQDWTFDAFGDVATYSDADGFTTTYRYDALGNAAGSSLVVDGRSRDQSATYDAFGRVLSQTDALGLTTTFSYDDATRTVTTTLPGGAQTVSIHNRFGQVVSFTDAAGMSTSYGYDGAGRLRATTRPDGSVGSSTYDDLGNLTSSTDAEGTVVVYHYDAAGHVLSQAVDPDGLNLVTTYVYDGIGRQVTLTDPAGNVRTNTYDGGGNVEESEVDDAQGNFVSRTDNYWIANRLRHSQTYAAGGKTADLWFDYDGYGRLINTQDKDYGTTNYAYDSNGNLILTATGDQWSLSGYTYYFYNEANQLILKVDTVTGSGYGSPETTDAATAYTYDADGHLLSSSQRASTVLDNDMETVRERDYNDAQTISSLDLFSEVYGFWAGDADRTTYQVYDADGRLAYQVDALGNVTETRYDQAGRVAEVLQYATAVTVDGDTAGRLRDGSESAAAFAILVAAAGNTSNSAHAQKSFYDAMGRVAFTMDVGVVAGARQGRVTETRYDADGRVVATILHDDLLQGSAIDGQSTATLQAWVGAHEGGIGTWTAYDAAGRPTWHIAADGSVSHDVYDPDGNIVLSSIYAHGIDSVGDGSEAAIAAAVAAANPAAADVRTTRKVYDALGNVLQVFQPGDTTASATYTYDAQNTVSSYTDALGNTWTYEYWNGFLVSQTSPAFAQTNHSGGASATTTTYERDGRGNVESVTVTGANFQQSTYYDLDDAGHVISVSTGDKVFNPDSGSVSYGDGAQHARATYNAFGEQVVYTDAQGNTSYKVYDKDGRLAYDIDGSGNVTSYSYDAWGNPVSTIRYAQPLNFGAIADWSQGTEITFGQVAGALSQGAGDRQVTTTYDGFGRKIQVSQAPVAWATGDGQAGTSRPTTRYTYDVRGNVIAAAVLMAGDADAANASWAITRTYYDNAGRQVMTVDPMGYVSTWTYDGFGEVTGQAEYATPIANPGLGGGETPPALPAANDADRSTLTTYDAAGRKTSESVLRSYTDATGHTVRGYVTTTYGYDAAGRATTVTEGGRTITTAYDAAGHITSVTAPAERVLVADWKALLAAHPSWDLTNDALYATAAQVMSYGYDAAGNQVVATHGSSAGGASSSTWYLFDGAGRELASTTAANGATPNWTSAQVSYNVYDGDGRLMQTVERMTDTGFTGGVVTVTTSYSYDAAGQQSGVTVQRSNATDPDSQTTSVYNAFGEVVSTGNGVVTKRSSVYDTAGRLTSWVDPATGVTHAYSYDLAGNLVRDTTHATGGAEVYIGYTRDLDGHVVSQVAPSTTAASGEGPARVATYDRWGNVLTSQDADGNITTYTYNERNQLVSTIGPAVNVVNAAGNTTFTTTTKSTSYDIDGHVVAVTDENGFTTRTVYDAAGQVVDVIDAVGAHTRVAYDSLGNEVAGQVGENTAGESSLHITFKEVDGQGRVIDEGDFFDNGSGYKATLRQVYVLDEAGNRVVVFDGLGSESLQAGDQAGAAHHATYYAYDSQGRVIASQTGAQRDFSGVDPNDFPPPVQQPRNLDLEAGSVGWVFNPASSGSEWAFTNGTAVYSGTNDSTSLMTNADRVPVTPGQVINAWADVWSTGAHGGVAVDVRWYDANGNSLGYDGGNIQTTDDGRGRTEVRATAPAGAAWAEIDVGATNNGNPDNKTTVYALGWDYTPPDGGLSPILDGSIFVSLPKINFSLQPLNPDFENGDSGWDKPAGWEIKQADNTANGKWIATYTGTSPSTMVNQNRAPVVPGQKITAHARITLDEHGSGDPAAALLILWYDANGNLIRYNSSNVITDGNDGTFQDVSVTDIAPDGAAYATIGLSGNGDGTGFAVFDAISWDYRYIPSLDPGATLNSFTYDRDGNLVASTNADGDTESWVRDAYGRVTDHTDLAGASYHYTYDASSGLQLTETDDWGSKEIADATVPGYVQGANGTSNSETRTYNAAGQVTSLVYADGSSYTYAYDANGNQVRQEATTVDGSGRAVHTVTTTTYDSHGRISQVTSDDGGEVLAETYTYDAAGNRRSIVATVTAGGVQKSSTTSWYDYDQDNRVVVNDGDLVDGAIKIGSRSTSYGMAYDSVGNLAAHLTMSGSTVRAQRNYYDTRGQLIRADYASDTQNPDAYKGIAETRTYDANGNVVLDSQYYAIGSTGNVRYNAKLDPDSPNYIGGGASQPTGNDVSGFLSTATITRYDTYGRVSTEQTFGHAEYWNGDGGDKTPDALPAADATTYSGMTLQSAVLYQGPGNSAGYDAMGNVVFYQYRVNSTRLDQYTVTYLKKESYLESSTSGQNITNLANVRPATDESYYNVRGERTAIAQHTQYAYGSVADTVRVFAFDGNGQIISRRDGTANGNAIDQGSDPTLKNQHYVYVNGQQVAHYDEKNTLDVLSQVTAFSSGTGSGDYVVQDGDTLKSIAQAVYGNASLWYIVAQANALTGDSDLAAGLSLTIPAVTTTKNDATTFKPYNPGAIQGSTTPDLPVIAPPPPPPKQHCNVVAAIVVIAVTVVVSYFAGPVAGNLAGQLAGDAMGTHHGISLKEAAISYVASEVGAGVGQYVGETTGSTLAAGASSAAASYATTVVASKALDQDTHFSWAGIVGSAVGGGFGSQFGPTIQEQLAGTAESTALQSASSYLVQGAVTRVVTEALGDHHVQSWSDIIGGAIGAGIGTAIVNDVKAYRLNQLNQKVMASIQKESDLLSSRSEDAFERGNANVALKSAEGFGLTDSGANPQIGDPAFNSGGRESFFAPSPDSPGYMQSSVSLTNPDAIRAEYPVGYVGGGRAPDGYGMHLPETLQDPAGRPFLGFYDPGNGRTSNLRMYDERTVQSGAFSDEAMADLDGLFERGFNSFTQSVLIRDNGVQPNAVPIGRLNGALVSELPSTVVTAADTGESYESSAPDLIDRLEGSARNGMATVAGLGVGAVKSVIKSGYLIGEGGYHLAVNSYGLAATELGSLDPANAARAQAFVKGWEALGQKINNIRQEPGTVITAGKAWAVGVGSDLSKAFTASDPFDRFVGGVDSAESIVDAGQLVAGGAGLVKAGIATATAFSDLTLLRATGTSLTDLAVATGATAIDVAGNVGVNLGRFLGTGATAVSDLTVNGLRNAASGIASGLNAMGDVIAQHADLAMAYTADVGGRIASAMDTGFAAVRGLSVDAAGDTWRITLGTGTMYDVQSLLPHGAFASLPVLPIRSPLVKVALGSNQTELPVYLVSRSKTPNIAENTVKAIAEGHPSVLNRLEGRSQISANRRAALRGQVAPNPDQSLDEYPFASSRQGGEGARVLAVPREEQAIQGGTLSQFYQAYNIKHGDAFLVRVVE